MAGRCLPTSRQNFPFFYLFITVSKLKTGTEETSPASWGRFFCFVYLSWRLQIYRLALALFEGF